MVFDYAQTDVKCSIDTVIGPIFYHLGQSEVIFVTLSAVEGLSY